MAQQPSQQEPTMEEILASIRRIISEDAEEVPKEAAPPPPVRARAPEPEPMPAMVEEEEVLELDQIVEEEPVMEEPEPPPPPPPPPRPAVQMRPQPAPRRAPEPEPEEEEELMLVDRDADGRQSLLSQGATSAISNAFGQLHQRQRVSDDPHATLEDIVKAMLKPMLQDWLEQNLPPLVERLVAEEIERVNRPSRRR